MTLRLILGFLLRLALISLPTASLAGNFGPFSIAESKPAHEVWLNPGFYSYHLQNNKKFNDNNHGFGFDYRYSSTHAFTAGRFLNSLGDRSHYAGMYWHPVAMGPIRLGAVIGGIDGYRKISDGGWFLAVIPAASYEYKSIGANLIFTPPYKDQLHGALSLQLKVKVH